ncbi:MAG: hypothetical protein PVI40_04655 [Chlamydiota bacterium]|jgi:hypothetical protein
MTNNVFSYDHHQERIIDNFIHTADGNFLKNQVLTRIGFLALIPYATITSAVNMIRGVGAGFATIVTAGNHLPSLRLAMNDLNSSQRIVSKVYMNFLKVLNPQAQFTSKEPRTSPGSIYRHLTVNSNAFITADGDGFITDHISSGLKSLARSYLSSENVFQRQIASRLTYVLLAVSSVITRVADGVIGSVAAVLSLLTLGKVESINNLAYRGLQIPGIVKDLVYCATKIINPWTGVKEKISPLLTEKKAAPTFA